MIITSIRTILSTSSHFILSLILVLLLVHQVNAQSATDGTTPLALTPGTPAGSYQLSGFENVNLFNGDLNFSLPLLNVGGRGEARVPVMLPIETRWRTYFYEYLTVTGQYANFEIATLNWWTSLRPGYGPGVLVGRLGLDSFTDCGDYYGHVQSAQYSLYRLTFTAPDGTEYELRDQLTNGMVSSAGFACPPGERQARGSVFVTADGTSMTFVSDTPLSDSNPPEKPSGFLIMPNGLRYRIDTGLVSWIRDRNGNRLSFAYDVNSRVIMITDSLNRQVSITYDVQDGTYGGLYDKITFNGYNGAPRVIHISKTSLSNALRNTQPNDDTSVHTASQLFPGLSGSQVNPTVVNQVWLPDNRSYRFYYNPYAELSRVELPTGGAFEYDWASGVTNNTSGVVFSNGKPPHAIYRRVIERRTYSNSTDLSTLAGKATYSRPESLDGYGMPHTLGYVLVNHYTDSSLMSREKHYFYGSPTEELLLLTPISYSSWKNAREYQSELIDSNGSTVLQRVVNNWQQPVSGSTWPLTQQETSNNVKSNNPHITSTVTTLEPSAANQVSQQTYAYDQYNNQTDVYEYDYGTGAVGSLVRRTHTDYLTTNPVNGADYTSTSIHIRSLPTQQQIFDAGGVELARTTYEYDNYVSDTYHAPLIDRPGISGLDSAFTSSYQTRGNPTRGSRWILSNGTSINTYAQYDVAGNGVKGIDGRGLVSQVEYSSSYQYAYPTHTISPIPDIGNNFCSATALETTTAYDLSTGLVTSSTDANWKTTTVEYNDVLDRPTRIVRPTGGGWTSFEYNRNQYGDYVHTQVLQNTSGTTTESYQYFDGLGRSYRSFQYINSDPNNPWLTSDTQYDSLGRAWKVSNSYMSSGSASAINPSGNWTTTAYDALGRVKTVTTPDGAQVVTTYSGNQVIAQDQKGKKRSSVTDALGRLRSVIEDPDGLAYQTTYDYDVLGNLSTVAQDMPPDAQHPQGVQQRRYFMYDSLSRLIRAKNPEQDANASFALSDPISGNSQWSAGYSYDSNGNLAARTDARGITTTYIYDNLNRNITVNYSDGTHIDRIYDSATNGRGRLRGSFYYPNTGAYSHTAIDTYDAMGRPLYQRQHFYANGGWGTAYVTQRNYDYAGHVTSQTYPSGRVVNYAYDQAGRTNTFTGNLGDGVTRTYAASISYDEWNGLAREQFGTDTPLYHKEHRNVRGQLYDMRLSTVNDDSNWNRGAIVNYYSFQPYGFGTSGPDNNGNLLVQQHYVPTDDAISGYSLMQQNYDYDALNRIRWVGEYQNAATATGAQDYSYDRYGNRSMTGWGTDINNQQFSVDANTNRIGVPSGQSGVMQYDANGNLYNDTYSGAGTRSYDAENRMVSATNIAGQQSVYTYDADGKRVRRNSYNQETRQAYGMDGELEAEYAANASLSTPQKEYGYRNGELLIVATSSSGLAATTLTAPEASAIAASSDSKVNLSTNLLAMNNSFVISEWRRKKEQGLISDTSLSLFPPSLMDASPALLQPQSSSQIVFASNRDGSAQLYLMNSDGSSQTRLTNNLTNDESPKWSPNNSRILFQSDRDNPYSCLAEVYVMNADGSGQTRLTNNTEDDSCPVWSPDGNRIAFQSSRNDLSYQVYVMNSDGSNQVNISNNNSNDGQPSWSPDGTKIAFTSDRDHQGIPSIYVMNSNGSSQTRLTFSAATIRDEQPAWSPDGMKLLFTSTRDSVVESWQETDDEGGIVNRTAVHTNKEVYLMNSDGSNQVRLTNTLENDDSPQWSADGAKIVFRSERERDGCDPVEQVWAMNSDGSTQVDVSSNGFGDYSPSWQRVMGNTPPTVIITNPANGATFSAPANIRINANASDSDGSISRVEFYQGTTLIGTDTTAPYAVSWNNVSSGSYQLTTKAIDNVGASSTSAAVNITVSAPTATADIRWIVTDQLGTPRIVADKSGSLAGISRHDNLPFGEEVGAGTGGRTSQQGYVVDTVRQKFTGSERDSETGLDFMQARYYSNTQGRFTSIDPLPSSGRLEIPQSLNRYTYALNNPLKYTDSTGLDWYIDKDRNVRWYEHDKQPSGFEPFSPKDNRYNISDTQSVTLNPNGPNPNGTTQEEIQGWSYGAHIDDSSGAGTALAGAGVVSLEPGAGQVAAAGLLLYALYLWATHEPVPIANRPPIIISQPPPLTLPAPRVSPNIYSDNLTDKVGKIASDLGVTVKEVKDAIHKVKNKGLPRGGPVRNPDVVVDTTTGEVYPKTPDGGVGDSIGNILDYLP